MSTNYPKVKSVSELWHELLEDKYPRKLRKVEPTDEALKEIEGQIKSEWINLPGGRASEWMLSVDPDTVIDSFDKKYNPEYYEWSCFYERAFSSFLKVLDKDPIGARKAVLDGDLLLEF